MKNKMEEYMDREMKQEIHLYCKDRDKRKNRYIHKEKDKQRREYELIGNKNSYRFHNKSQKFEIEEW